MVGVFFTVWAKKIFKIRAHFFSILSAHWVKKTPDEFGPNMQKGEKKKIQDQQFFYDDEDIG